METMTREYRQSTNAILISYALFKWFIALCTIGITAIYDWLMYRNTKLVAEDQFLVFVTGALVTKSKEIPFEDIKNVRVEQSIIGKWFNFGTILITMKEDTDTVLFKFVHEPEAVRKAIQTLYVRSAKLKMV